MKNKLLKTALLLLCFIVPQISYSMNYSDVHPGFWSYGQLDELTSEGVISGYPELDYKPDDYITRAEYAAMIVKAIGQESSPIEKMYSFEDIDSSHWAWNYVLRAVNLDILKPSDDGYFYPNDYVPRSEVITFLVNILKTEDITKQEALNALEHAYKDYEDVPDWFKVTAGKAEVLNVIAKQPPRQDYLDYDKYVTRAQMAVFISNMLREINSYKTAQLKKQQSPKKGDGLVIENVTYYDDVATLPAQTVLPITVIGQLASDDTEPGKMFQARFFNDIIDEEHNLLLSRDTILIGKVLDTTKAKYFIRNGGIVFEISAANKNNNLTRIMAAAEYEAYITESGKVKKIIKSIIKGKNFEVKDGQILYIKLFKPLRVNVVTGQILD